MLVGGARMLDAGVLSVDDIILAGSSKFEEATAYIEKHRLYKEALSIWEAHGEERDTILNLFGDHLFERREFRQAALGS